MTFCFEPIGVIHSCYKEKFGIPRQSGLVTAAEATLELYAPYDCREALAELEGFSHIWVVFVFHQIKRQAWKPTVRPPRLGGNQRIGVFASRSPFRPNPIGLSAVLLEGIDCTGGRCRLRLRGADLVDGTPVLDIKPYLPYADALPEAQAGYAALAPDSGLSVSFNAMAAQQCADQEQSGFPGLRQLIEQMLRADPRPAYCVGRDTQKRFGMRVYDFDVQWSATGQVIEVLALIPIIESK
jgi:tRNA-Thr(GGU) m(6)t(6)A37 methyltransferase TsaA